MRTGMDAVFGLHHVAHAHNAEVGATRWPAWTPAKHERLVARGGS